MIVSFGLGWVVGAIAIRSHYTGRDPSEFSSEESADDGGPNFH